MNFCISSRNTIIGVQGYMHGKVCVTDLLPIIRSGYKRGINNCRQKTIIMICQM